MGATKDFYSYGSRIVIFNEKEKITGEILGQPVDGFFTISIGGGIFGTISVPEKLLRYDIQSGFFVCNVDQELQVKLDKLPTARSILLLYALAGFIALTSILKIAGII